MHLDRHLCLNPTTLLKLNLKLKNVVVKTKVGISFGRYFGLG